MKNTHLDSQKTITYRSYLDIDALLKLQKPESKEHDEMLFIIIHQVYELWFKQLLHETDYLKTRFEANDLPRSLHTLKRMLSILKTVVSQIDILETMTPLEFNGFRDRLGSSSGFQSYQFRELEFLLGYKREALLKHHPVGSEGRKKLEQRFYAPSLWDSFLELLKHNGYSLPEASETRDLSRALEPSADLQQILISIYRKQGDLANLCERLLDIDEGILEWRYRHVKMVERTIGHKAGTGGSAGASYLSTTLKPLFPDLWEIRSQL